jgi:hypothetical protein
LGVISIRVTGSPFLAVAIFADDQPRPPEVNGWVSLTIKCRISQHPWEREKKGPRMHEDLARICYEGGNLEGVICTFFEENPRFLTSITLKFEHLTARFEAQPNDDTLELFIDPVLAVSNDQQGVFVEPSPWDSCVGLGLAWAWWLTNQQGYRDGVRLEFIAQDKGPKIVELLVVASGIYIFEPKQVECTPRVKL